MIRVYCHAVTEKSVLIELLRSEDDRLHFFLYMRIPGLRIRQCSAGEGLQYCCSDAFIGRIARYHQWLLAITYDTMGAFVTNLLTSSTSSCCAVALHGTQFHGTSFLVSYRMGSIVSDSFVRNVVKYESAEPHNAFHVSMWPHCSNNLDHLWVGLQSIVYYHRFRVR